MTCIRLPVSRPVMLAAILAFVVLGAVSGQGGSPGSAQGAGSPISGGEVTGGGSPSGVEPAVPEPAGTGEVLSGKPSGTTGRTGTERRIEPGSADTRANALEMEFDSWLATSKEGSRLGSVYERLLASAIPALVAGVPLDAFKARIREAAAKGAAPDIVAGAIEEDTKRWIWLANLVKSGSWPPEKAAAGFYLSAASALRNGLGEAAVRDLVIWAAASRTSPERAGAALTAAVTLSTALGTRSGQAESVARMLAASKLKIGQYDSVAALARRSLAAGIGAERFIATLEATLGKGLKLSDLEKALFP